MRDADTADARRRRRGAIGGEEQRTRKVMSQCAVRAAIITGTARDLGTRFAGGHEVAVETEMLDGTTRGHAEHMRVPESLRNATRVPSVRPTCVWMRGCNIDSPIDFAHEGAV